MKIIESELNAFFDTDFTLIIPPKDPNNPEIMITMPGDLTPTGKDSHKAHVQALRSLKQRGYTIFVWSHNGKDHAANVVKLLGLEPYVDYVLTKSMKTFDDKKDHDSIIGMLIYLNPGEC